MAASSSSASGPRGLRTDIASNRSWRHSSRAHRSARRSEAAKRAATKARSSPVFCILALRMLLLPLTALALSAKPPVVLDPLSLLGDKAAQTTTLNSYAPIAGCEMATLAMS